MVAASSKVHGRTIATTLRKLFAAIRSPSTPPTTHKPRAAASDGHGASSKNQAVGKTITRTSVLLAACFGFISICFILLVALLLQIKAMRSEMARSETDLAATNGRLAKSEKLVQQLIAKDSSSAINQSQHADNQPHAALALSQDDRKIIRQFIKILPPKPGAKSSIQLGDQVLSSSSAPIPGELVDRIPKLRGARFSIDQDGTIVIFGEGSSHADALIAHQQPK